MTSIGEDLVEVLPSAARLMASLRDTGYDVATSAADIIDNSIQAGATKVEVLGSWLGVKSSVAFLDNGCGMTAEQLKEAMRFGTERTYDSEDLGKFGLGLKLASIAQCRSLTVASRKRGSNELTIMSWDLDQVAVTNKWEVKILGESALPAPVLAHLNSVESGTTVIWNKLDRMQKYKNEWGDGARTHFLEIMRDIEDHVSMTFHRFIEGDAGLPQKVSILINGKIIEPWDPYARREPGTELLIDQHLDVQAQGNLRLRCYILPKHFVDPQGRNLAGRRNWNHLQGLYIYRNNRPLQMGGWSSMWKVEDHFKLCRCSLDFQSDLDEAFKVNIAKRRITLSPAVKEVIKEHLVAARDIAEAVFRKKREQGGNGAPARSVAASEKKENAQSVRAAVTASSPSNRDSAGSGVVDVPAPSIATSIRLAALDAGEAPAWKKIELALRISNPGVWNAIQR